MKVPFLDLTAAHRELAPALEPALIAALHSGQYIGGPAVERFESNFARYVQARHCVSVGNGLDALQLTLAALDIGPGDEVIVPAQTFIATWFAVSACNATPVAVDCDDATGNIDPSAIVAAIGPQTRAIVPVHLFGQPADLTPILQIAERHRLAVVDDAAQAHGARYQGRRIGAIARAATWSFYPGKNLGGLGDAGAVTTDDPILADRIRLARNYGSRHKYEHEVMGRNSRLDPIQAVVLDVKLGVLDEWNARRARLAERYRERLAGLPVRLPACLPGAVPAWHLFVIRTPMRDALREHLRGQGVECGIHYPHTPFQSPAYRQRVHPAAYGVARAWARESLSLPLGPQLSLDQVDWACQCIEDFFT